MQVLWAELGQLGDATYNAERREQALATQVCILPVQFQAKLRRYDI